MVFVALALKTKNREECMSLGRCHKTFSASTLKYFLGVCSVPACAAPETCLFVVLVQLRSPGVHLGAGLRAKVRADRTQPRGIFFDTFSVDSRHSPIIHQLLWSFVVGGPRRGNDAEPQVHETCSSSRMCESPRTACGVSCNIAELRPISRCWPTTHRCCFRFWLVTCSSRAMGDREAIGRTLTLASGLAIGAGAIIAVLFYINSAGLLSLMGAPKEVMGLAVPYLRWRASAFPANLFLLVACGAFRCVGGMVLLTLRLHLPLCSCGISEFSIG